MPVREPALALQQAATHETPTLKPGIGPRSDSDDSVGGARSFYKRSELLAPRLGPCQQNC